MRRIVALTLCAALAAAACAGPEAEEVATVDGTVITLDDVSEMFGDGTILIDDGFRMATFRLVAYEVLVDAYRDDFAGEMDEAAAEEMFRSFLDDLEEAGVSIATATGIQDATEEMIRFDARLTVLRDDVIDRLLSDEEFLAGMMERPRSVTEACASHILVDTEEAATAALERVQGGEDFAAVADEVSLDDQSVGGDLGCNTVALFVTQFADALMEAEPGVPYGPVETPFGWHVILLESRSTPTAEELAADPGAFLSQDDIQSVWLDWFDAQLADAEITVNPKYGAWDTTTLRIVAPES